jgi:hypothetical protein
MGGWRGGGVQGRFPDRGGGGVARKRPISLSFGLESGKLEE